MTVMTKRHEMHVISHSHWDREWRYSFAEYRLKLVDMMDRLLELLRAHPEYKHYHLDGQTILLEDYLEARPEKERLLKRYIREGRILIGPWYTLPDEFLVAGESLVRNLLRGHRTTGRFGPVMKVGYTPTSCGQISQLPQLYAGFDIDSIFFYRGLNVSEAPAEFIWQAPDGSRALTFHFYSWGRANFFALILVPVLNGGWKDTTLTDLKKHFHLANTPYPYVHEIPQVSEEYHPDQLVGTLKKVKADAISKAGTPYLLYMDGCDNGAPHPITTRIIAEANAMKTGDRYLHSTLPVYVEKVRAAAGKLRVLTGEMRRPGKTLSNAVYPGVLSARIYLKQMNARAEYNLMGRAEPWAAIAWLLGKDYPQGLLDRAWRYLLANHTHDSIEACSTDRVHDDMEYRFAQCDETARGIYRRSLRTVVSTLPVNAGPELSLIVFNPLPHPRSEVVSGTVDLPALEKQEVVKCSRSGALVKSVKPLPEGQITGFSLFDGPREVPFQVVSSEKRNILVERAEVNTGSFPALRFLIRFAADHVPALGYKVFRLVPNGRRADEGPALCRGPRTLENEFLRVTVNRNGSLTVKDKETGRVFKGLNVFEDAGETGTSLRHGAPAHDRIATSAKGRADLILLQTGAMSVTAQVKVRLAIPVAAEPGGKSRSRRKETMEIVSAITLRRGSRRVEIVTELENRMKDHRLRVLFPTGIATGCSWAGGQFDVLKRPIRTVERKKWAESKVSTHPQYYFVDLSDGQAGLAILPEGLTEYEVLEDRERTVAVTLVRAFATICGTPSRDDVGGQCLRRFRFRYALLPHAGDYQAGDVFQESQRFNLPLEVAQGGRSGTEAGFFEITPASLVLSALKRSERGDSVIVRFFNPSTKNTRAVVSCFRKIRNAWITNLNEERREALEVADKKTVAIDAPSKKIVTLEVQL